MIFQPLWIRNLGMIHWRRLNSKLLLRLLLYQDWTRQAIPLPGPVSDNRQPQNIHFQVHSPGTLQDAASSRGSWLPPAGTVSEEEKQHPEQKLQALCDLTSKPRHPLCCIVLIRTRSPSPHSRGGDDAACGDQRWVSRAISQVAHYRCIDYGPCVSLRSKIFRPRLEKCVCAKSCPALCNPMGYSPPGSSLHGILQARILEWVAMPSSRGSS